MATPMQVEVVSPEGQIWEGQSVGVSVRNVEGSLGILSDHEPLLTILAPGAAEIITLDGRREVIAVSGGFMTVNENVVTILTDSAEMGHEISLEEARRELAQLEELRGEGDNDDEDEHRYNQVLSQIRAAEKYHELHG
ncbi:MAG: ATP synthase F1 subunit epsilon [Propionibacteriaceae bacterium]|jgi:F-type H+-transporting ATPase subunit epsilon|nr:ATP synthase F1 subunit epsilon [Propionibacteriaceae bacterium]